MVNITVNNQFDPFQILMDFKEQLGIPFFMEVLILMSWAIWKARNDFIFRQILPNLQSTRSFFRDELKLLMLRMKRSVIPRFEQWIANLV